MLPQIEFPGFLAKWLDLQVFFKVYKNTSDELKVRLASLHIEVGDALGWHKMYCGKWRRPEIGEDGFFRFLACGARVGKKIELAVGEDRVGAACGGRGCGRLGSISIMGSSAFSLRQSRKRLAQCFLKDTFWIHKEGCLLIGLGVTVAGIGLESGLEYLGVDPLQAGNVVQLVLVLGLTVGWISTYIFRVSNKEMTYAQQLRDYEVKVMEKRLESLTEAEIEALLEQVEEEKRRLAGGEQMK
ncbi:UNVERIFIED_CONTAM: hypothetical protein Scaly_2629000 [Sesamum calycinum]|uniref:Uncharacterized protein n=1 Tax=Sesamum calycinum TaxID=2727403 RepID=A0AAW2JBD9_9LAMI